MRKKFFILLLALLVLGGCSKDYWVWDKKDLDKEPAVRTYVKQLEDNQKELKGYKLFSTSLNKNTVVVSTGSSNVKLELVDVQFSDDKTVITVKEMEAEGEEINPYLLVHLEKKSGSVKVETDTGEEYELVL